MPGNDYFSITFLSDSFVMKPFYKTLPFLFLIVIHPAYWLHAQNSPAFAFGDLLPDAPELAARDSFAVGVRTFTIIHQQQQDILNRKDGVTPVYDRPLVLEVWYPAAPGTDPEQIETYQQVLGNHGDETRPLIPFSFTGRCVRDADPDRDHGPYPLVIVSHGYTGSRYLMTYLTENLASKGYVVVAIDHTESTFQDAAAFTSTLLNRPLDQLFTLNEIGRLAQPNSGHFLAGLVDADHAGLIGYSMGGYGALNTTGAGFSSRAVGLFSGMAAGSDALAMRGANSEAYRKSQDPRFKAVVAFAPWGMNVGVWDSVGLTGLHLPTFFVAGDQDDVSGYEQGTKKIFDGAIHAERYLLTYVNARHNVAPNPPPVASMQPGLNINEYLRYADSVWDMRRINNINQHFVTAFLGYYLKGIPYKEYLDLSPDANLEVWKGFKPRTSIGLRWEYQPARE